MNAVSAGILIVLLLAVCFGSRRWALLAVISGVFFLTQGHAIEAAGLRLYPMRFLVGFVFLRVVVRGELDWSRLNPIDYTFLALYNYAALVWVLRSSVFEAQQLASAIDPALCYLAFRGIIRGIDDLRWLLMVFVLLLLPFTALIYTERVTGQNAFLLVGGYPQLYFRDGVPRCMGPFRHAILMGSIAASFLSLYLGLVFGEKRRVWPAIGALLCVALVALSNSGGPVTSGGAALLGWLLWPARNRMYIVRRATVAVLLGLVYFMKAPIWYLPFKISSIVGGGGYHRSVLMERAWGDLGKWWLFGMDVKDTAHWMSYTLEVLGGGVDVTNQFLVFGIRGGLLALGLLVFVLSLGFIAVGTTLASPASTTNEGTKHRFLLWGLGVALFVHAVSWLGISYFDQSWVIWLMHLATVSAVVPAAQSTVAERGNVKPATARRVPSPAMALSHRRMRIPARRRF